MGSSRSSRSAPLMSALPISSSFIWPPLSALACFSQSLERPSSSRILAARSVEASSGALPEPLQRGPKEALSGVVLLGDEDVLEDVQLREERRDLEGPGDARAVDPVRCPPRDALGLVEDVAPVWLVEPRDQVDEGGLARTVRPYQDGDLLGLEAERDAVDGLKLPEGLAELLDLQNVRCCGHR